jgi:Na+-transporting methylmalonyl-CoA/oxaloacetate decarboxylase gamma subunit
MSATSKETAAIWPGYVAAIASLVLSLLLLLAILVFAMTQVGNMVTKYTEQLMRAALEQEADNKESPAPQVAPPPVAKQPPKKPVPPAPPGTPLKQIRFVFEARLASIPAAQASEAAAAIRQLAAPSDARWLITASTPVDDATTERSTYRLMLAVRRTLVETGVAEASIDMRLDRNTTRTPEQKAGVIAITLAPMHALTPERKKP